jgi:hypothetical protein
VIFETNQIGSEDTRVKTEQDYFAAGVSIVFLVLIYGTTYSVDAQQTIFNVPTTDVLDKGKVYLELDASLKPTDGAVVPKFSSFVPRIVVGAGGRVEAACPEIRRK